MKINGAALHEEDIPFTDSFDAGDTVKFVYAQDIPSFSPSGTYTLTFQFYDSKNKANGCVGFTFKL